MGPELSGVTAGRAPSSDRPDAASCDQAVFTSVRTPMGEGYRLIAASPGLSPAEKTAITKCSPSHGGLCETDEHAQAFAYYPLPGGRVCAARSCTAGKEQTGRGGHRIYTRAVVLDGTALSVFGHNPFGILRAMEEAGLDQPELKPEKILPPAALSPGELRAEEATSTAVRDVGVAWLTYVLQTSLAQRRVILAGKSDSNALIEAVFAALPRPLRESVSFAAGLKFSISRAFALTAITGDTGATERIIRGHPLALVRPHSDAAPPAIEHSKWQQMVVEHWEDRAYRELHDFASQPFEGCTADSFERIAGFRSDIRAVPASDGRALLAMVARQVAPAGASEIERQLQNKLFEHVAGRLRYIWLDAAPLDISADWPALAGALANPCAFDHVIPLAGLALRRLAHTAPPVAMQCALSIASAEVASAIETELSDVADRMRRWLPTADRAQSKEAHKAIALWKKSYPGVHFPGG